MLRCTILRDHIRVMKRAVIQHKYRIRAFERVGNQNQINLENARNELELHHIDKEQIPGYAER